VKVGGDYWLTNAWRLGVDLLIASDQFLRRRRGNDNPKLSAMP